MLFYFHACWPLTWASFSNFFSIVCTRQASRGKDFDVKNALHRAMLALAEPTPQQKLIVEKSGTGSRLVNRGRIVLLTHITDREKLKVSSST